MFQSIFPKAHDARITVLQGQVVVGNGQNEILTTVLGSCIACCLYDPVSGVGGMNHFLLAEPQHKNAELDQHYGLYLMELLINKMMAQGALKARMKAHIYGGANMHAGMTRIGDANAAFAKSFLATEGIELVRANVGGMQARRVEFDPLRGRARCRVIDQPVANQHENRADVSSGDVELF